MNKKMQILGIMGIVLTITLFRNVASPIDINESHVPLKDDIVEIIEVTFDRVESAENLSRVLAKAPIIVVKGSITGSKSIPNKMNSLPITLFTFKVDEVLRGEVESDIIEIWQYGGTITVEVNGTSKEYLYQISDDPSLKVGEESVYLLKKTDYPDAYRLWGAYQGHFIIRDGLVYNIAELTPELTNEANVQVFKNGMSYSQFKEELTK